MPTGGNSGSRRNGGTSQRCLSDCCAQTSGYRRRYPRRGEESFKNSNRYNEERQKVSIYFFLLTSVVMKLKD